MINNKETIDYRKYPILYIDDLKINLTSFMSSFEEDFTINIAENTKQALELLGKERISVILADQRMPEMTGVEFFKIIKDKYPQIVRILITAYTDIDAVISAINEGNVYSYINKPVQDEDLKEKIKHGIYTHYITEERDRLFQEKLDAMKKLANANRLNAAICMASGLSDRLNNYLCSIKTFFDTFPQRLENINSQLSDKDKEVLKGNLFSPSCNDVNKMISLSKEIGNLFSVPSYTFNKYEAKTIINITEQVKEDLKSELEKKDIKIAEEVEGNPSAVYFDSNAIKQILRNLLQNAIHAIPETRSGSILVKVCGPIQKSGREFTRIIVQDNGTGISEKHLENIFNPFFTTKGTAGGFGLGLTTCQFIITQHDGEIEVTNSKVGEGTTVYVDLPVKNKAPENTVDFIDILGMFPNRRK